MENELKMENPENVTEAVKILRNELLKHEDLYDGFTASITSITNIK